MIFMQTIHNISFKPLKVHNFQLLRLTNLNFHITLGPLFPFGFQNSFPKHFHLDIINFLQIDIRLHHNRLDFMIINAVVFEQASHPRHHTDEILVKPALYDRFVLFELGLEFLRRLMLRLGVREGLFLELSKGLEDGVVDLLLE